MARVKPVRISVVIPTCDRPDFLVRALRSLLIQSHPPHEIIVVDNGSTPAHVASTSAVRVMRGLPRFGVAQARNYGALSSTGDFIAFLDDDDTLDASYLEAVAREIELNNGAVAAYICSRRHADSGIPVLNKQVNFTNSKDLLCQCFERNPGVVGSNVVFERGAFFASKGYDPTLPSGEDKGLVVDLLLAGKSVCRVNSAWTEVWDDFRSSRLTNKRNRALGKLHFTAKYAKHMTFRQVILGYAQFVKLYLQSLQ